MKLTVAFPNKNHSAKLLRHLKESVLPYFDKTGITYEVLIYNDHSNEENTKILNDGVKDMPMQVKVLPYPENPTPFGKGWGINQMALAADSDYFLFMDADLSTDLSCFDSMKKDIGKYDAYIASRNLKESIIPEKQGFVRNIVHYCSKTIILTKFGLKGLTDTQCGFKMFRTKVLKEIAKRQIVWMFAFDVEYLWFLKLNGFSIKEYPCTWTNDADSSIKGVVKTSLAFSKDLNRIKRNKKAYILSEDERKKLC